MFPRARLCIQDMSAPGLQVHVSEASQGWEHDLKYLLKLHVNVGLTTACKYHSESQ